MAINRTTIDNARRTPFFKKTKEGGLVDLYFDSVTIDGQSFYQPVWPGRRTEDGRTPFGVMTAPVILENNMELPITNRPTRDQYGVWYYGGR